MKKVVFICCAIAAICASLVSCENKDNGYAGTNYIYLSASANSMFDRETITVDVDLTTALEADLLLTFKVNDTEGIITLEGNDMTIKAGEKNAKFTIKSAPLAVESKNFTITLDESVVLPEKVVLQGDFNFTVNMSAIPELTTEQKAIVAAYQTATGIDLNKYLGLVAVSTVYTASNPDSDIPNPAETISGYSIITLSEESTEEQPVLKMTVNPMGLRDALYEKFLNMTVKNTAMWFDEYSSPNYKTLCDEIMWSETSNETFGMTLDNINLNGEEVDFVADLSYYDEDYEEYVALFKVPFEFSYTAYDREIAALEEGRIGVEVDEYWLEDATADPAYHLNCEDISEDWFECGNHVEAIASISAEKLEFTFCIYNYQDYDYSKVVATYTPNK